TFPFRSSSRFWPATRTLARSNSCASGAESIGLSRIAASESWLVPICPLCNLTCTGSAARPRVWIPTVPCCADSRWKRRITPTTQLEPPSGCSPSRQPIFSHSPLICGTLAPNRSEEHTSELQSRFDLVCRLLLHPTPTLFPYTTLFRSNLIFTGSAARPRVWIPTVPCCADSRWNRRITPTTQLEPPSGCSPSRQPIFSHSPLICGTLAPNPPALTFSTIQLSTLLGSNCTSPVGSSAARTPS